MKRYHAIQIYQKTFYKKSLCKLEIQLADKGRQ